MDFKPFWCLFKDFELNNILSEKQMIPVSLENVTFESWNVHTGILEAASGCFEKPNSRYFKRIAT